MKSKTDETRIRFNAAGKMFRLISMNTSGEKIICKQNNRAAPAMVPADEQAAGLDKSPLKTATTNGLQHAPLPNRLMTGETDPLQEIAAIWPGHTGSGPIHELSVIRPEGAGNTCLQVPEDRSGIANNHDEQDLKTQGLLCQDTSASPENCSTEKAAPDTPGGPA